MITLNSIRIRNFRAIKELTFKPKEEGITGIFGQNGAGKTSILTAVMFALYGVRPKGINVSALRKIGSEAEECSVSVVFTHLGQQVEIIRELKGTNNRVVVNIYVDGQAETVTSVGAADKWMTKRLGIDPDGFLTAFVVRQKELDSFVRADPAERKRIIEKLAGVETINQALKSAREDEKDSKKTVDLLPGSQEQVDSAGSEVDYYTEVASETEAALNTARETLNALNSERAQLNTTLQELRNHARELDRLNSTIDRLEREIPDLEAQIARVDYIREVSEEDNVESLREKYRTLTEEVNDLRAKQAQVAHELQQLTNRKQQLTSAVDKSREEITALRSKTEGRTTESVQAEIDTATEQNNQHRATISQLTAQNAELEESIRMLEGTADCPTCKTQLSNPAALINQFKATIASNNETLAELTTKMGEFVNVKAVAATQLKELTRLEQMGDALSAAEHELTEVETKLNSIPSTVELETKLNKLVKEQERVVELGSKARTLVQDRTLHASLIQKRETALHELAESKVTKERVEKSFKASDYEKAESQLNAMGYEYDKTAKEVNELTSKNTEANVRFQTARQNYTRVYEQWEKKKGLQEAHASKTLTTDMLEKFRKDVVSSIAPELSDYATELISSMTNGDFTEIKLDDDFKASLVDAQGVERPVAWLSGGEESAVALALRLGVAALITGGNSELLWLDEPLTAQDKDRRASILSMIRSLPTKQILLINHAQEAQDIVDYEITLKKED